MGNNFLKMLNDIDEKNKAIINKNKSKNKFDIKSCSTQDLKVLKKLINAELKSRRSKRFWGFVNIRVGFLGLLATIATIVVTYLVSK